MFKRSPVVAARHLVQGFKASSSWRRSSSILFGSQFTTGVGAPSSSVVVSCGGFSNNTTKTTPNTILVLNRALDQRRTFSWSSFFGFGKEATAAVAGSSSSNPLSSTTTNTMNLSVASPLSGSTTMNRYPSSTESSTTTTTTTTNNNMTTDSNPLQSPPVEEDHFNGLQFIHETADYEYRAPLTFGEEHEMFLGGHVPNSMPHINAIQDFLQYLHDTIGKQYISIIVS